MAKSRARSKSAKKAAAASSRTTRQNQPSRSEPEPAEQSSSQDVEMSQDSPAKSTMGSQQSNASSVRPAGSTKPALMQHRRFGVPVLPPGKMLTSARNRFDDLLATISKGEEYYDFHDSDEEEVDPARKRIIKKKSTPSKATSKPGDKIDAPMIPEKESQQNKANTFVLKLFERSVDLAQFGTVGSNGDDVPLYPVCRAWIKNDPNAIVRFDSQQTSVPDDASDDGMDGGQGRSSLIGEAGVYRLPEPNDRPVDNHGNEIDLRIPFAMKPSVEDAHSNLDHLFGKGGQTAASTAPNKASLMSSNLKHWRSVRKDWKDAAASNETRYAHSLKVLQSMFDRTVWEPDYDSVVKQD